jgi:RNA polymerase sigma-70 factor, ECF subfamily
MSGCSASEQLVLGSAIERHMDGRTAIERGKSYAQSSRVTVFADCEAAFQQESDADAIATAGITKAFGSDYAMSSDSALDCPVTRHDQASDEQLVEAARFGDQRAFAELTDRYSSMVKQRIFKIVRNREDAEDVLQDALLKAYYHLDQFRGSSKFSTWLNRIAINTALMLLRKRRRMSETSFDRTDEDGHSWERWDFPDPAPDAEQLYAGLQTNYLVLHALRELPAHLQSIVGRYHDEECSIQQVAAALGITVTAVKSRLYRARRRLRSAMRKRNVTIMDMQY